MRKKNENFIQAGDKFQQDIQRLKAHLLLLPTTFTHHSCLYPAIRPPYLHLMNLVIYPLPRLRPHFIGQPGNKVQN